MAYAYQADIWCDDCGDAIKAVLIAEGQQNIGDTNDWPQWGDDDEPTDSPQHCASGKTCINAITLPYGGKIGCLIGTSLTKEGVECVKEAIADARERVAKFGDKAEPHSVQVCELWAEEFFPYLQVEEEGGEDAQVWNSILNRWE
jgi:hypothetical protein